MGNAEYMGSILWAVFELTTNPDIVCDSP